MQGQGTGTLAVGEQCSREDRLLRKETSGPLSDFSPVGSSTMILTGAIAGDSGEGQEIGKSQDPFGGGGGGIQTMIWSWAETVGAPFRSGSDLHVCW